MIENLKLEPAEKTPSWDSRTIEPIINLYVREPSSTPHCALKTADLRKVNFRNTVAATIESKRGGQLHSQLRNSSCRSSLIDRDAYATFCDRLVEPT